MRWDDAMEDILRERDWKTLAETMTCGNCGCIINVDSEYSCKSCGRMLCEDCVKRWEVCKDHKPVCYHPELFPTEWNQPKPEPTTVIGRCRHNYHCPVCGFGHGSYPCPCDPPIKINYYGVD